MTEINNKGLDIYACPLINGLVFIVALSLLSWQPSEPVARVMFGVLVVVLTLQLLLLAPMSILKPFVRKRMVRDMEKGTSSK